MAKKGKKIITSKTAMPQIVLLISQFLFITVLIGGFSFISHASFMAYEKSLSPLNVQMEEGYFFE